MKYNNILKRQTGIIAISVICMVIILLGSSYALFMRVDESTNLQTVETGTLLAQFQSGTSLTTALVPQGDDEGLATAGYSFAVTNTGTLPIKYEVSIHNDLAVDLSNDLSFKYIKVSLDGSKPMLLSSLSKTKETENETNENNMHLIVRSNLVVDVSETKTHNIKVWIDEDAPTSIIGKTVALELSVDGVVAEDKSGAISPELYDGMIAVTYDDKGNTVVADTSSTWYNYTNHEWANAVLVDRANYTELPAGSIIPEDKILQYYVWIPRYRYLLWNAENGSSDPQAINIVFEDKSTPKSNGSHNGEWLTHPAFTFGDTELNGIWVGKFENSTSDPTCQGANETEATCNKSTLPVTIKPNQSSWVYASVSNQFNAIRNIELVNANRYGLSADQIDTHMMKNMEWGAVAYLSSSIYGRYNDSSTCIPSGCEVWLNNVKNNNANLAGTTGCSNIFFGAPTVVSLTCPLGYDWVTGGVNASTTGNQHGIYDMSGGSWEYTMGNMVDASGNFSALLSGFDTALDSKYYDSYNYGTSYTDYSRGKLGDATRETLENIGSTVGGWYESDVYFSYLFNNSWFYRGSCIVRYSKNGLFTYMTMNGNLNNDLSSRSVLTAE